MDFYGTSDNSVYFETTGSYTLDVSEYVSSSNTVTATNSNVTIVKSLNDANNGTLNAVEAGNVASVPDVQRSYGQSVLTVMNGILNLDIDRSAPPAPETASPMLGYDEINPRIQDPLKIMGDGVAVSGSNLLWARGFGGQQFYNATDTTSSHYGLAVGIDHQFDQERIGLLAGASRLVNKADDGSGKVTGTFGFGGAYWRHPLGAFTLDAQMVGGGLSATSERTVNTTETAEGDLNGWFFSPELRLSRDYALSGDWSLTPSAALRYTAAGFGAYSEHGSSQNISYDDQTTHTLEGIVGIKLSKAARLQDGKLGKVSFTGELVNSTRLGSGDMSASLSGTDFTVSTMDDRNVLGARIGIGGELMISDNLSLFTNAKVGRYSDNSSSWSADAGLKISF
ncbi:autotransporter domain-containing protein [Pleomorphomonas sp. JP5]|uniref:autotransporter outer membrane beta-barrel domain-containing protein n=1 Tax=Pleomorphomonas sp. JP5 TaxID=2942998 RepID=UPI002042E113|nr:autotransporter domain-containing protein [Pleomorphomonas sp. JP5]MCM5557324.1 autotransporter outer membrane beta-barrel domain-containing protein [Pleomorphomonas sp. JP5]